MGVTLEEFWHLNPHKISVISDGYNEKIKQEMIINDRLNWMMGQYVLSALTVVMDGFSKSPKAKYIEKPMLSDEITDEEQEELEMKKEIEAMERWISNDKQRGLPQTTIRW